MQRKKLLLALLVIALAGGLLLLEPFLFTGNSRGYSSDLNDLRAGFNQDKGSVRLLMLLSPT